MPMIMPSYTGSPGLALLQLPQRIGGRDAVVLQDQDAVAPLADLPKLGRQLPSSTLFVPASRQQGVVDVQVRPR